MFPCRQSLPVPHALPSLASSLSLSLSLFPFAMFCPSSNKGLFGSSASSVKLFPFLCEGRFPYLAGLLLGFKMVDVDQTSLETVDWLFGLHWVMIGGFGAFVFGCAAFHGATFAIMEAFQATSVAPFGDASSPVWTWLCAVFFLLVVSIIYKVEGVLGSGSLYLAVFVAQWWIPFAADIGFSVVAYASLSIGLLVVLPLLVFFFIVVCLFWFFL